MLLYHTRRLVNINFVRRFTNLMKKNNHPLWVAVVF